ncbi:MAG: hypothetical protein EXS32_17320 [Opitutus sp.]|nr:hypothetical protein [Opitutus sp.]
MRKFPHLRRWIVALIFGASVRNYVECQGVPVSTDPFLITEKLWPEQFWQDATDSMPDCRSVTGKHP